MTTRTRPDGVPLSSGQAGMEYAERLIETENEKLRKIAEGSTYFQHAQASALDESGGRFFKQSPTTVVGASAGPSYPMLPEGASGAIPWPEHSDLLGYSVDQMEPVGSEAEIERAAEILREREAAVLPQTAASAAVTLSAATVSLAVGEPIVTAALQSKSPPITCAAVGGDAGDSAANSVPRTSIRRL